MIFGRIIKGKIQIQRFFKSDILKWEGKEIEIRKVEPTRSEQQNRYMWGIIYKLVSDHTGFTSEEVHSVFKKLFLTYEKSYKGRIYKFTKSTTNLTISEFSEYLDKVIKYAQEHLKIIIPEAEIAYEEL